MKYYGYTRTSTKTQKLDRGVIEIEEFGRKRKIKIERIFTDQICGKVFERKGYNTLLKLLERGDCVIIPEMDRLGRSKTAIGEELYTFKSTIRFLLRLAHLIQLEVVPYPVVLPETFQRKREKHIYSRTVYLRLNLPCELT